MTEPTEPTNLTPNGNSKGREESDFRYWLRVFMTQNGYTPKTLKQGYWILLAFVQFLESVELARPPAERVWWRIDS